MRKEEFIEIFQNCGLDIRKIYGYYFFHQDIKNYSFPPILKIPVNNYLVKSLRWKYLMSIVLTDGQKKNTYEFILNTTDYGLDKFARKTRNRIKKSLHNCSFKKPSLEDLLKFGLEINRQTIKRQFRKDKTLTNIKIWNKYISSIYSLNDIIIFGAYFDGRMVGYLVVYELEGKYIIYHAYIDRKDSETTSPMNGLIYVLINQIIKEKGSIIISYGLDSFTPLHELNRFKCNMLFEKKSVSRIYILNPVLTSLLGLVIIYNFKLLKRKNVRNSFTRKIIYLFQGNRLLRQNVRKLTSTQKTYFKVDDNVTIRLE